jgi:hypothetical protein
MVRPAGKVGKISLKARVGSRQDASSEILATDKWLLAGIPGFSRHAKQAEFSAGDVTAGTGISSNYLLSVFNKVTLKGELFHEYPATY